MDEKTLLKDERLGMEGMKMGERTKRGRRWSLRVLNFKF
jgi:NOL1/NOP2/fmu family ribosome biogenesis protein